MSHTTRERKNALKENIINSRSRFLHAISFLFIATGESDKENWTGLLTAQYCPLVRRLQL